MPRNPGPDDLASIIQNQEDRLDRLELAQPVEPKWTAMPISWFNTNWKTYDIGTPQNYVVSYWKDPFGVVHWKGLVQKAAAVAMPDLMFTLPANSGLRPATPNETYWPCFWVDGGVFKTVMVYLSAGFQMYCYVLSSGAAANTGAVNSYLSIGNVRYPTH